MIISKIIGGLGNQMFQYSAGRALSLERKCELKLDISEFDSYELHNGYELGIFNCKSTIATPEEIVTLTGFQSKFAGQIRRRLGAVKRSHIVESDFFFSPTFHQIQSPAYLEGYWQSYKYFQPYQQDILRELEFNAPLTDKNEQWAEKIEKSTSVSIHVRRGDYLTNPKFSKIHGFVGLEYYKASIAKMLTNFSGVRFFVFSDEINWVQAHLELPSGTFFISHNTGINSYEDMRLMSKCRHNIIANSSFSWWGAYLNRNLDKVVVCPGNWLAKGSTVPDYDKFIESLFPSEWVVL